MIGDDAAVNLKAKLEAIIYAAETPVSFDHLLQLVKDSVITEEAAEGAADDAEVK